MFETGDEKRFLHGGVIRCYDKVREYAPYRIEHVDIPWNGTVVSGNLHLAPGEGRKPLVFYVPGCDQTKEAWPHTYNGSVTMKPRSSVWEADIHAFVCDWLRERFNGVPMKHAGKTLWLEPSGAGPNAQSVTYKRRWFD